jgi:hypothetical protein
VQHCSLLLLLTLIFCSRDFAAGMFRRSLENHSQKDSAEPQPFTVREFKLKRSGK